MSIRHVLVVLFLFACACLHVSNANAQPCDGEAVTTTPSRSTLGVRPGEIYRLSQTFAGKDVDLVLVGDSLAQLFDESILKPMSVLNLGVGGDRTQNALYLLSSPRWSEIKPRNVAIILGTNNLPFDKPCSIMAGLKEVITRVATLWPSTRILFVDIPPRGDRYLAFNSSRTEVNAAINKLPGITAINVDNEITCAWQTDLGRLCKNYRSDNVHFAAGGYRVIARAIKRAIGP